MLLLSRQPLHAIGGRLCESTEGRMPWMLARKSRCPYFGRHLAAVETFAEGVFQPPRGFSISERLAISQKRGGRRSIEAEPLDAFIACDNAHIFPECQDGLIIDRFDLDLAPAGQKRADELRL